MTGAPPLLSTSKYTKDPNSFTSRKIPLGTRILLDTARWAYLWPCKACINFRFCIGNWKPKLKDPGSASVVREFTSESFFITERWFTFSLALSRTFFLQKTTLAISRQLWCIRNLAYRCHSFVNWNHSFRRDQWEMHFLNGRIETGMQSLLVRTQHLLSTLLILQFRWLLPTMQGLCIGCRIFRVVFSKSRSE